MAAEAPEVSPTNNSTSPPSPSPPDSSSPPPESIPSTPEKSPPPPTPSPPPPSPPPPSPPPPPSSPPPSPSKGSNQNNVPHTPPPPKLTPQIASPPTVPPLPPPKHSPPQKSHPSDSNSNTDGGSNSNDLSSHLPLILGLTVGVVLLLGIVISLVIVMCCRKKKKETMNHNNHMQFYNNYTPPQGDGGYGNAAGLAPAGHMNNGHEANSVPPNGGAAGHGGWQPPPSPQGQTPSTQGHMSYSSEMSSNVAGQPMPPPAHVSPSPLGLNQSSFSYEELSMATFGFSQGQMLGQGGFGYVHKGVLAGGKEVAVKSLKSGSGQGEREFQAEVGTISRVHHRHLVSLVGYCVAGERRMLVYEFLPNKTLEYHLHEKGPMDWPTRLKIALGAAKGLAYLHEDCHPRIIHRDIKSANILLDYTFEAKARPLCESAMETGNFSELVDPRLENNFVHLEMARMVACAGASIRHSARRRPKMRQIVRALEDDVPLDEVKGVVAATRSSRFSTTNDTANAEYDPSSYSTDMKRFRKMVLDSQDYTSSDSGNTGEYGHNPSSSSSSSGSSGPIAPTQS